ncbi:MAG: dihydroorotase [Brevinema sp.]
MICFKNARLANKEIVDILVENGKIIEIAPRISMQTETIDCEGRLLLSGMIDSHVHFRDPGFPHKEDATSGSKCALRGGVTSFLDMPNTKPLCTSPEELAHKKSIYREHSYANFGFHFGGDARDNSEHLADPKEYAALKIFLNESTGHMLIEDDLVLDKLFAKAKYIAVHAEGDAVDKAIYFAKKHRNILYLCHISQQEEVQIIQKAKSDKLPVFAEVCPHHILFNTSQETDLLTMKPRLRSERDQKAMLEALDRGIIDTWGTDHAPHLIEEKKAQLTYGIPALEFALEILLTLAKEMSWSYEKVQSLYSSMPAHIFQIQHKGKISVGYDADFVLIEDEGYTISHKDVISKCAWTPYEGYKTTAQIHSTYIGGDLVYRRDTNEFFLSKYTKELSYDK